AQGDDLVRRAVRSIGVFCYGPRIVEDHGNARPFQAALAAFMFLLRVIPELRPLSRTKSQRTQRRVRRPAHEELADVGLHSGYLSTRKVQAYGHPKPQIRLEIELSLGRLLDRLCTDLFASRGRVRIV